MIFNCETQFCNSISSLAVKGVGLVFRGSGGRRPSTHRESEANETNDQRERERKPQQGTKNGKPTQSKGTKNEKPTIERAKLKKDN